MTSTKIGNNQVRAGNLGPTIDEFGAARPIAANGEAEATVQCPAGTRVLSGGGTTDDVVRVFGVASAPLPPNGWSWVARNTDPERS